MSQSKLLVSPIGTCRIHTPLRKGTARYPIQAQSARNYGFVHTSAEALQQLRFMCGQQSIPAEIETLVFRPGVASATYEKPWVPADLYIVELSSRKLLTVDGYPIQINYMGRYFADFFADRARSRMFWSMASAKKMAERRAWLDQEPNFRRLTTADQALLARIVRSEQSDEAIERDMREIAALAGSDKLVFVTHVDAAPPDSPVIEQRHRLIEAVSAISRRMNVPCYDPTLLMHEAGQANAMEQGGLDLTHFTDAFADRLVDDWHRRFLAARIAASGLRDGGARLQKEAEPVDEAANIESAWNEGRLCEASRRVRAVLRADKTRTDHGLLLARMQCELGDYEGAISALKAIDADNGPNDHADRLLMRCCFELGDFQQALALSTAMLGDEVETPELLRISASAATRLGDVKTALASWKRLFRISNDNAEAASAVLSLLESAGDLDGAEGWAEEVRATLPGHAPSHALLWNRKLDAGDRAALMRLANEPLRLHAREALALAERAAAEGFAAPAAALAVSQAFARNEDSDVAGWLTRQVTQWLAEGQAAVAAGELRVAADRIQAASSAEPDNQDALRARRALERHMRQAARAGIVAQDFDATVGIIDIALQTGIAFPDLDSLRGRAAEALGDTATALRHLRLAADEPGAPVAARLHLARVAVRAERYTEAIEAFWQIATNDETEPSMRDDAARQISMLRGRAIRAARDMLARQEYDAAWALLGLIERADPSNADVAVEKKRVITALRAQLRGLDSASGEERMALGEAILGLMPDDPVGLKAAASGAMRLHRFAHALPYWDALRKQSGDVEQIDANIRKCLLWIERDKRKTSTSPDPAKTA
ncbi:Tetratricopeptide repeat family protein 1 [Burkholderia sp. 8Y]|uniref:tetratricopeptide repeat protein n=1 Tax=Burkholderia sp. 8Y TaxID=2653133 RepID=UPI0012F2245E|nr:tetratricopeptide repeat protein [Burkholderia sp. 8Y]VXB02085.1 Tetratricopeptide repeat family protein 1 [Burkholderia sp. 8Y]